MIKLARLDFDQNDMGMFGAPPRCSLKVLPGMNEPMSRPIKEMSDTSGKGINEVSKNISSLGMNMSCNSTD